MPNDEYIERNLVNHPPDEITQQKMEEVRGFYHEAARIVHHLPPSRERSLALTNLEQSLMWAIAGLARGNYDERRAERPPHGDTEVTGG